MPRLWEVDHPFYCVKSNYFAPEDDQPEGRFSSWEEFIEDRGDEDRDMNLIFRFDWCEGSEYDLPEYDGNDSARTAQLSLFYVLQRKGHYCWVVINVCRDDEPQIRQWLQKSYNQMLQLWQPFSLILP